MLTVRFANGFSIQYNSANNIVAGDNATHIYQDAEHKYWVATIPKGADCIIEASKPCSLYNAMPVGDIGELLNNAKSFTSYAEREQLGQLKRLLQDFNLRTMHFNGTD